MKGFKKILALLISLFLIGIAAFNIRLYYQPTFKQQGPSQLNQDLIHHLAHLKEKLHAGAASDMQQLYPEGFVFLNAVYGFMASFTSLASGNTRKEKLAARILIPGRSFGA
ncbi:MAG: hypothetical protein ACKV1O_27070 [Saprospiraceae bacterium]